MVVTANVSEHVFGGAATVVLFALIEGVGVARPPEVAGAMLAGWLAGGIPGSRFTVVDPFRAEVPDGVRLLRDLPGWVPVLPVGVGSVGPGSVVAEQAAVPLGTVIALNAFSTAVHVALLDQPGAPFLGVAEAAQGPMAAALANALAKKLET